jgi:hypothetical protein
MSTHAVIAIVNKNGKIKAASVAYDGYPDYMMPILKKLKTRKAAEEIIDAMDTDGFFSLVYDPKTRKVDVAVRWSTSSPKKLKVVFKDFGELWSEFGPPFDYYYIFGLNGSKWEWVDSFDFEERFIQ